jgi:hypothetical protein
MVYSPNGWCGNAEQHCGAGCQANFGECGVESSPESGLAPQQSISGPQSYAVPSFTTVSMSSSSSATTAGPTSYSTSLSETTTSPSTSSVYSASSSESSQQPVAPSPSSTVSASSSTVPTYNTPGTSSYSSVSPTATSGSGAQSQGGPYIKTFTGDGSKENGWPGQDQWLPFETLWDINQNIMNSSCSEIWSLGSGTDNTEQELANVKSAIEELSAETKIDKVFIYVVMQQESLGCVRVRTTSFSHANPGLFQSNQGAGSCNNGTNIQIPCPQSEIKQMIQDGVAGTPSGDGLEQLFEKATGETAQKYYRAARMYNSGSLDPSGSLGRGGATACYCSDIANRLLGWSQGASKCTVAEVSA